MASHYRICITGLIQGVGFRPFIYTLAQAHGICGTVYNNSDGVVIDCSCSPDCLDLFVADIGSKAPTVAHILTITVKTLATSSVYSDFSICNSQKHNSSSIYISPDLALCETCRQELFAPDNHRHLHPFINCTGCGSRYTIISDTPYDRPVTSMASFAMCDRCQQEYVDVGNRRFHAEPICCSECGPQCKLTLLADESVSHDLTECGMLLREGLIGALKGVGGYQICCDASNSRAIHKVRKFKNRPDKPFAIMANSLDDIERLCHVSLKEQAVLRSSACPIVLLQLKDPQLVSSAICRGNTRIGVMLSPSGLHQLALQYSELPFLLMTSANRAGEPLITDGKRLRQDLSPLLDFCIDHNRTIINRVDDSVVIVQGEGARLVRRARGYAPQALVTPLQVEGVLALGGQQKNTFTMGRKQEAFIGPHIGTLGFLETNQFLLESIATYKALFQLDYKAVVHDLHPAYDTTKMAGDFGLQQIAVQHHHAHHASCMAEHQLTEPCIGIILDGSGYGADGSLWGGEILVADFKGYKRLCHFDTVLMPGGEQAVKQPFRMALAYLFEFLDEGELTRQFGDQEDFQLVYSLVQNGGGVVTSSCGRLFDVVAFLLGFNGEVSFEGQPAILVEQWAEKSSTADVYETVLQDEHQNIPTLKLIREVWLDIGLQTLKTDVSRKFLNTLTALLLKTVLQVRQETSLNRVVFSGGVFQNRILSEDCEYQFSQAGFECFSHKTVPCNDGGLSLGQLCVAATSLNKENV